MRQGYTGTIERSKENFKDATDTYLADCKGCGVEPKRPNPPWPQGLTFPARKLEKWLAVDPSAEKYLAWTLCKILRPGKSTKQVREISSFKLKQKVIINR